MRELNPCHHGNAIDHSRGLSCVHCEGEKDLMRDVVRWRDDAFEASAQIVERYFGADASYCAGDIRALKSSVAKTNS